MWVIADAENVLYTDEQLESYGDGVEFIEYMCDLDTASLLFERGVAIRVMLPSNPI